MHPVAFAALAAGLFVATDLDDLLVLVAFFGDPRYRTGEIVAGQILGMAAIFGASVTASLTVLALPREVVGFLGLVPIGLGLRGLACSARRSHGVEGAPRPVHAPTSRRRLATVAAVTLSNGGDNIAAYAAALSTRSLSEVTLFGLVVLLMTVLWCVMARLALRHPAVVPLASRIGTKALPFLMIGLGLSILWRQDSLSVLGFR